MHLEVSIQSSEQNYIRNRRITLQYKYSLIISDSFIILHHHNSKSNITEIISSPHFVNLTLIWIIKPGGLSILGRHHGLYNQFMKNINSVVLGIALLTTVLASTCTVPTTIVNSSSLSSIFNKTVSLINYKPELLSLISSPSIDTIKTYLMTKSAYVIPLWCIGGLSFVMLIGCCLQICCYNCCGQK